MFVQIDVLAKILFAGMHVFPRREHELAAHETAAGGDEFFELRHVEVVRHGPDRSRSGVSVDGRAGQHQTAHLLRVARGIHCQHPAALAQADQVNAPADVVHRDVDLGQVVVDVVVLHVLRRGFPVRDIDAGQTVLQQGLHQALPGGEVGNDRGMAGIRRIDDRRYFVADAVLREIPEPHRVQVEFDLVGRRESGFESVFQPGGFGHGFQPTGERAELLGGDCVRELEGPEPGNAILGFRGDGSLLADGCVVLGHSIHPRFICRRKIQTPCRPRGSQRAGTVVRGVLKVPD